MKAKYLFVLFIPLLLESCIDLVSQNKSKTFGIYLLKDTLLITSDAKKLPISSIQLQEAPVINISDIVDYNWEEQIITLTPDALKRFKGIEKRIKSIYGLPFMVVADNQKIYLGNIYPLYSSYIHMDLPLINYAPFVELKILRAPLQSVEDKRKDKRIYSILNQYNKLKK